eukprot:gene21528-27563_t
MRKSEVGLKSSHVYQRMAQAYINLSKKKILSMDSEADKLKEMKNGFEKAYTTLATGMQVKAKPENAMTVMFRSVKKDLKALSEPVAETAGDEVVTFQKRATAQTQSSSSSSGGSVQMASAGDAADDSSSDDDDQQTQQIDFQPQKMSATLPGSTNHTTRTTSSITPAPKSLPIARSSGLSGKCVRVTSSSNNKDCDSDEETEVAKPSVSVAPSLSVYVDENMENFAPVWKGASSADSRSLVFNDENKPPPAVSSLATPATPAAFRGLSARPTAKLTFAIEETAADTPKPAASAIVLKKRTATPAKASSVKSPPVKTGNKRKVEEDEEDGDTKDALNDSVVEFKSHKRLKSTVSSKSSSSRRAQSADDVVTFASKPSASAVSGDQSGEDEDGTVKFADSISDSIGATATIAMPMIMSTPLVSTIGGRFAYTPPVAPPPVVESPVRVAASPEASVDSDEDTERVQTPPVSATGAMVTDSAVKSSAAKKSLDDSSPLTEDMMDVDTVQIPVAAKQESAVKPTRLAMTPQAPVLSVANPNQLFRTATPLFVQNAVAAESNAAMETPVSSKRKRRVSFAGANENDPPLVTAAADTPVPAHRSSVVSGENKDSNAVLAVASTKSTSNSKQATGGFKNNFDDPANQIVLNGHQYVQFGVIGKGGSGVVTRIVSKETGATFAYKRIAISDHNCDHDAVERQFEDHENEIKLLRQLRGSPLIIELVDFEVNREALYVSMVLELGDIDLARVLSGFQKQVLPTNTAKSSKPDSTQAALSPFMPRELDPRKIWREMLECVQCIHDQNIIHG